jgi:malate dehydrogenase (oxaloacetate-decarboxylating)(NADP+)
LVTKGLTLEEARAKIHLFDINGLIESSRIDLSDFQRPYAHKHSPMSVGQFAEAIKELKPTTIIGVSTMGGAFTKEVIEAISAVNTRPIILALSNPTQHAECTSEEAYKWSKGKAIYAAGVQFPPVLFEGKTFLPGQANNFFIFPAVGMAIYATNASRVTDEMFIEAAYAVASEVSDEHLEQGLLYPLQDNILETEIRTAAKVAKLIFDLGLARVSKPNGSYEDFIRKHVYHPSYDN